MSKLIETRAEFQQLAELRLEEAQSLLAVGKWDGAHYLAGYAVELGLKSCIIRFLMSNDAFPDKEFSRNCYTHDIEKLARLANVLDELKIAMDAEPELLANWVLARDWSEELRYHRVSRAEAEQLYSAISDPAHGVLPWIRIRW